MRSQGDAWLVRVPNFRSDKIEEIKSLEGSEGSIGFVGEKGGIKKWNGGYTTLDSGVNKEG